MVYVTSDLGFAVANDTFISVHNSTRTLLEEQTIPSQIQMRSSITEFVSDEREDLTPNPSCSTGLARIIRAKIDGCCNVM